MARSMLLPSRDERSSSNKPRTHGRELTRHRVRFPLCAGIHQRKQWHAWKRQNRTIWGRSRYGARYGDGPRTRPRTH